MFRAYYCYRRFLEFVFCCIENVLFQRCFFGTYSVTVTLPSYGDPDCHTADAVAVNIHSDTDRDTACLTLYTCIREFCAASQFATIRADDIRDGVFDCFFGLFGGFGSRFNCVRYVVGPATTSTTSPTVAATPTTAPASTAATTAMDFQVKIVVTRVN